jgi:hypothetical protein
MDKESWRRGGDSQPDLSVETSFDEVAKGLASGTISRRHALRWMGGALVGGVLASIPGVALAQPGGNSACAHFCTQSFPPGSQRGQCTSQGAQGTGPCYSCTPGIGPGPNFVPPECPGGEFNPETCECEAAACAGNPLPEGACDNQATCGEANQLCGCLPTTEASFFCIQHGSCGEPCTSTLDCPEGKACVFSCCGGESAAFCQFPCGVQGAAAVQGGPTTFPPAVS